MSSAFKISRVKALEVLKNRLVVEQKNLANLDKDWDAYEKEYKEWEKKCIASVSVKSVVQCMIYPTNDTFTLIVKVPCKGPKTPGGHHNKEHSRNMLLNKINELESMIRMLDLVETNTVPVKSLPNLANYL